MSGSNRSRAASSAAAAKCEADVVIIGAGPAGLVLGNILQRADIDCIILERAQREHVLTRARAGYLTTNTVQILDRHGLSAALHRNSLSHSVCEFRSEQGQFRLEYGDLSQHGPHTVYPQQHLVTDLLTHYLDAGGRVNFTTEAVAVLDARSARPTVAVRNANGTTGHWRARYIAGCDGRQGIARRSLPPSTIRHCHDHGVSWLGILAEAPPSLDGVGYAMHHKGFAGHMARTSQVTRYYLQVERGEPAGAWPEARIWHELAQRMRAQRYGPLNRGRIIQRTVIDLESDVIEPLRHGSLFLVGDAASRLSPSAAKGANLAILEAEILGHALTDDLIQGSSEELARYSARCLKHIWRAQEFSHWMARLLHTPPLPNSYEALFHDALRLSCLETLRTSRTHQQWFAEGYAGV